MNEEIWKTIDGFPSYEVSNLGRIRNKNTGHILKPQLNTRTGYLQVGLFVDKKHKSIYIHRLVAENFIGKRPPKKDINHIDGDKFNNKSSNLEYCTRRENIEHSYINGLNPIKIKIKIIETGEVFDSINNCARHIDGDPELIRQCLSDKYNRYSHKGYHFKIVEKPKKSTFSVPVEIVETGEKFDSVRSCASAIDGNHTNVRIALKNGNSYKGLHFKKTQPKRTQFLYDYQMEAVEKMNNGCILCGSVGSGKSRTGLFYYFKENGGWIDESGYKPMRDPQDLYIITTAKKRDSLEWCGELSPFLMSIDPELNYYKGQKIVIDSWNNIPKYIDVKNSFFLLDEQRLVSYGTWTKSFLKISKNNNWILLSATPGDSYLDYLPVFLANGFFENKSEFIREHVIYSRFSKYPKIDRYIGTQRLDRLRRRVLVNMNYKHQINKHDENIYCSYNISNYKDVMRNRWDIYKDEPIKDAAGLCYVLRRVVNSDESRQVKLLEILEEHPKAIIFYNFTYELEILRAIFENSDFIMAEYNGQKHQDCPTGDKWVYLCQYNAASEGWQCIRTDTIIFYSQNYSYKMTTQAAGRIDRLNTPFKDLYYYHLKSRSGIDLAISKALSQKKKFNEGKFVKW